MNFLSLSEMTRHLSFEIRFTIAQPQFMQIKWVGVSNWKKWIFLADACVGTYLAIVLVTFINPSWIKIGQWWSRFFSSEDKTQLSCDQHANHRATGKKVKSLLDHRAHFFIIKQNKIRAWSQVKQVKLRAKRSQRYQTLLGPTVSALSCSVLCGVGGSIQTVLPIPNNVQLGNRPWQCMTNLTWMTKLPWIPCMMGVRVCESTRFLGMPFKRTQQLMSYASIITAKKKLKCWALLAQSLKRFKLRPSTSSGLFKRSQYIDLVQQSWGPLLYSRSFPRD